MRARAQHTQSVDSFSIDRTQTAPERSLKAMIAAAQVTQTKADYKGVEESFDDGASIPLSTCDGNKKALFIGAMHYCCRSLLPLIHSRFLQTIVQHLSRFD